MANYEYADEIKKKKKKKGKKLKGKEKGKKGSWGIFKSKWKKRRRTKMDNPLQLFISWQVSSGALDGWTSYHILAGLFIAKVAQWLGSI